MLAARCDRTNRRLKDKTKGKKMSKKNNTNKTTKAVATGADEKITIRKKDLVIILSSLEDMNHSIANMADCIEAVCRSLKKPVTQLEKASRSNVIKDKDGNWYAVGKDGEKYLICNRHDIARLEKAASAK